MTTQISSNEERAMALQRFGYNPRESEFLTLAAVHSGYFLRRQYATFLGQEDGGSVTQLIDKVLDFGHASATTFRQKTQIYHLNSRPFYARIDQEINRNRRAKEPTTIKNRLLCLDFVLAHQDCKYLATQREKLDFFVHQTKIPISNLPAKLYRSTKEPVATPSYFVDKYPVFVAPSGSSNVSFCFVDEGMVTLSKFETYLGQYSTLFSALPEFSLIYVAATLTHFQRARELFEHPVEGNNLGSEHNQNGRTAAGLHHYFELRRRYDTKQFASLDRAQLIQLRDAREKYLGPEIEALYFRWVVDGDRIWIRENPERSRPEAHFSGQFSTFLLPYSYEFFGQVSTL